MKPVKPFGKKLVIKKDTLVSMGVTTSIKTGMRAETCNNACMDTSAAAICGSACGPCSACG